MALSQEESALINQLSMRHDQEIPELELLDRYYEGTQPLSYMHPEIYREVADRIKPVIVFWPQLVVGSREERLDIEGFRMPGDEAADKELWRIWQANDMVEGSSMAHVDSLVMRRSYVCVGTNEDDPATPLITVESPLELYADIDPRTRKIRAALRRVNDVDPSGAIGGRAATLYLPNETIWCEWDGGWKETARDVHGVGEVLVTPLVNRQRLRGATRTPRNLAVERLGRSELDPIIPLSDAVCKLATDMMVSAEFVAIPLRALFGVGPDAFQDEQGNPMSALKAMLGRMLTIPDEDVKAFEFAAAQLANFGAGIRELAQMVSAVGALPPDYLGYSSNNPASAEAGRVAETRLIKRCERIIEARKPNWRRVQRHVMRLKDGKFDPDLVLLETDFRDPSTPTVAAAADAAVKLYSTQPRPIVPLRQTREDLRYTPGQIERMEAEDDKAAAADPMREIVNQMGAGRIGDQPAPNGGPPAREPVPAGVG
ncbi:MAG TPA: phage portal protein [Actinoplanes sp.]|nr:phage portal protein [Actinoplanes sp.]